MPRVQTIAHNIDSVTRTSDVITTEKVDFSALHLSQAVLNGLKNSGFERPSPIQLRAIPIGRIGLDLIAQAKSGTGKTCVFGVIVLEALNINVQKCQCIIVAPTREIASQIQNVLSVLGSDIEGLKCTLLIGGTSVQLDKEAVLGAHIVIGTPGRILHLIEDNVLETECIRTLVLDEADKLVDDSFYTQVKSLVSQLPKSKQVLAMSATYDKDIDDKFNSMMRDPYFVRISADNVGLEGIHHFYYTVKTDKVKHQIFCNKISRLEEILSNVTFEQCLVFSNYTNGAEEISVALTKEGFSNQVIAGNMAQKDRTQAMSDFRECRFRVLISTDVTSRGIDNEHVDLVVNLDLPVNTLGAPDPHTYLHRSGRAGRFGKYGAAVSIIASQTERLFIQDLEDKYQVKVNAGPSYDQITELLRRSKLQVREEPLPEVTNGWLNPSPDPHTLTEDDITVLRSSVKVTQKSKSDGEIMTSKNDTKETFTHSKSSPPEATSDCFTVYEKEEIDGATALSSLGSLGTNIPETSAQLLPSEEDNSVFNFSSKDVNTYQEDQEQLLEVIGSLTLNDAEDISPSLPSTCSSTLSQKNNTDNEEISRSRRGSKNQKEKKRKPPKSLNMTSPRGQSGRRAQSATAAFADSNILSPHTPKWRSEAVSTTGCIIHSKAINVKFLLENYLNLNYDHADKEYETGHRGFFPTRIEILKNASTALCEVSGKDDKPTEKTPISRFVSHGFVAVSDTDPLTTNANGPAATNGPVSDDKQNVPQKFHHELLDDDSTFARKPCCHHPDTFDDIACTSNHSLSSQKGACTSTSSFSSVRQHPCVHHRPTDIPHLCREQSKDSGVFSYTSPYPPCYTPHYPHPCYTQGWPYVWPYVPHPAHGGAYPAHGGAYPPHGGAYPPPYGYTPSPPVPPSCGPSSYGQPSCGQPNCGPQSFGQPPYGYTPPPGHNPYCSGNCSSPRFNSAPSHFSSTDNLNANLANGECEWNKAWSKAYNENT